MGRTHRHTTAAAAVLVRRHCTVMVVAIDARILAPKETQRDSLAPTRKAYERRWALTATLSTSEKWALERSSTNTVGCTHLLRPPSWLQTSIF